MRYEIPDEPKVDRLWTSDAETGEPVEWIRDGDGLYRQDMTTAPYSWPEFLRKYGPVDDIHPDLWGLPPTPWTIDEGDGDPWAVPVVTDADGEGVDMTSRPVCRAIVRLINTFAAERSDTDA